MQRAILRITERGLAVEQYADSLHGGEGSGPSGHCAEHSVFGASVAIFRVEGIADEAAVARLVGAVSGEGSDLALETAYGGGE